MNSSPKALASGGGLSVTLGVPGHLSTAKSVPYHLYNSFGALLPHQPEGLGMQRSSAMTLPSYWFQLRRGQQGTGSMVSL